jgi:putative transposase
LLQTWNDHARYTYNATVWRLNTDIDKQSKYNLRNAIVPAEMNRNKSWILETPKEIRARAVFEAFTRWKTGITQIKNKTIKFFSLKYKDKKYQDANGWSIDIQKNAIKLIDSRSLYIYKQKTNKEVFKLRENIDMDIQHDCKICFDGDSYYLIVPYTKLKVHKEVDNGIISLDPGVRTFLTGIDNTKTIELGIGSGTTIFKKMKYLDKLISKNSKKIDKREKKKVKKQIKKMRIKIKNLQEELHKKTSGWLCKNYSNIVIPKFGSKNMVKKVDRKLQTKTVRAMSVLAHGKFLERLHHKGEEYGTNIVVIDEKYTSKTCSCCGNVKTKRFTSKVYQCEKCLLKIDRDRNGAINILKKLFSPIGENRAGRAKMDDTQVEKTSSRRVAKAIVSVCQS